MAEIRVGRYIILLDDNRFNDLSRYTWSIRTQPNTNYAFCHVNITTLQMHQMVLPNEDKDLVIDHIDRNGLNNQLSNLRLVSQSQNCMRKVIGENNTSGYKGVAYQKSRKKWYASIQHCGQSINLGRWNTAEEAALAYNQMATKLFGEFANLNELT